jgi:hypothetical protein
MSFPRESNKDESFPWISSNNMAKWDILLRAYLKPKKNADRALDEDRPSPDETKLRRIVRAGGTGSGNQDLTLFRKQLRLSVKMWYKRNDIAYAALVKAAHYDPSAMTVVLDNAKATAKELMAKLKDRFDLGQMVGVVQSKLSAFNSMKIATSEKATDFINSIIMAKIDLNSLGCSYIDKDVFCLGRLKEGLLADTRYKDVALNLSCAPDISWDRAVQVVMAFEASSPTLSKGGEMPKAGAESASSDGPVSFAAVRRLRARFDKKLRSLKEKSGGHKGSTKTCNYCKKPGHLEAQCRAKKGSSGGNTKGSEKRTCFKCGKVGHIAPNCREGKTSGRAPHVDDSFSEDEFARMLAEPLYADRPTKPGKTIMDSGATSHMLARSSARGFKDKDIHFSSQKVHTAKVGESLTAVGRGRIGALSEVLVMEDDTLAEDIASVPRLDLDGHFMLFGEHRVRILSKEQISRVQDALRGTSPRAEAQLGSDMTYRLDLQDLVEERALLGSAMPEESLDLWHRRLGHRNRRDLSRAVKENLLSGVSNKASVNKKSGLCDCCAKAKCTRHSFSRSKKASVPEGRKSIQPKLSIIRKVVTDLKGPISISGQKGERHMQLFTEEDTKWRTCKFLKSKSEAAETLKEYVLVDLASEGQRLLEYHSDGAPELISKENVTFLANNHCKLSYSPASTPELNGLAERSNRTIWESGYAMWLGSVLPALFWTFAMLYATIIANYLPTNTAKGWISPFQAKYGQVPEVNIFRIFGCICYVHIAAELRDATLTDKAYKGYFVGLTWPLMDRYMVFVPELDKVMESAHVLFDEVTTNTRRVEELLMVDNERKTTKDFEFLTHMAYKDDENDVLYVTTRVTTSRGFIVAYRAPWVGGALGQEEPQPVHAKDVEIMLVSYLSNHLPLMLINDTLSPICSADISQGAPRENMVPRSDQPQGFSEPRMRATAPPADNLGTAVEKVHRENPCATGKKTLEERTSADAVPIADQTCTTTTPAGKGHHPAAGRDRPMRARIPRRVENVSKLGNITSERTAYLAAQEIEEVDETDDRDTIWDTAKVEEMRSLVLEHDAWATQKLPEGRTAITTKWVTKKKEKPVPKLKARFTPRGFSQRKGLDYDETFAPVAKLVTLRIFLSLVAILCLSTMQLDLKTAFLNATLEEEIYCMPVYDHAYILKLLYKSLTDATMKAKVARQMADIRNGFVLRMLKACYGLKQAPRAWWKQLSEFLESIGFVANKADVCFYVLHVAKGVYVLLLLYVDDIIFAGSTDELTAQYSTMVSRRFRISSEGPLTTYLGFDIRLEPSTQKIYVCMQRFMEKVFKKFKMVAKASVKTPLPENFQASLEAAEQGGFTLDEQYTLDFMYRHKVGSILYYMICMRPDIAYSVGLLARYSNKISGVACAGVTQLLQFCYNTRKIELALGGTKASVVAYFDSDWAGDRATRRSTGMHIIYMGIGPVEWCSRLQKLVAQSTCEAEYMAANAPARSILWLRTLLHQTGIEAIITKYSSTIYGDNTASLAMMGNPVHHDRTKHIAIKYFFIRDLVAAGVLSREHVESGDNYADIGTKPLGRIKFEHLQPGSLGQGELQRPTKRQKTEVSSEFV